MRRTEATAPPGDNLMGQQYFVVEAEQQLNHFPARGSISIIGYDPQTGIIHAGEIRKETDIGTYCTQVNKTHDGLEFYMVREADKPTALAEKVRSYISDITDVVHRCHSPNVIIRFDREKRKVKIGRRPDAQRMRRSYHIRNAG